jgi:hypothetical protein
MTPNEQESGQKRRVDGNRFFAVDRRCWAEAADLGVNFAISYLVLALGTGQDNVSTCWSANAIEKRTPIGRGTAKLCIQKLIDKGLVEKTRAGCHPAYRLRPYSELVELRSSLHFGANEATFIEKLNHRGHEDISAKDRTKFRELRETRRIWLDRGTWRDALDASFSGDRAANLIWLPATLLPEDSARFGCPLERVRQVNDKLLLRLFIDLYFFHDLAEQSGVLRSVLNGEYDSRRAGEFAEFPLLAFRKRTRKVYRTADEAIWAHFGPAGNSGAAEAFWERLQLLDVLGLISWIPYLWESNETFSLAIHPVAIDEGEEPERNIGTAADAAGRSCLPASQLVELRTRREQVVPVHSHRATRAHVSSVMRMKYRPQTKATAAWWANLKQQEEPLIQQLRDLEARGRRSFGKESAGA